MSTHTLSVLVENKPGVLAHVAGLFSRRAFNISSLAVGPTEDERVSRMTIVVDGLSTPVEQVTAQLNKLVRVLKVVELHEDGAVERELALVKVRIDPAARSQVLEVLDHYGLCELVRTGRVALARGGATITDDDLSAVPAAARA